jgi:hypothetical protein
VGSFEWKDERYYIPVLISAETFAVSLSRKNHLPDTSLAMPACVRQCNTAISLTTDDRYECSRILSAAMIFTAYSGQDDWLLASRMI